MATGTPSNVKTAEADVSVDLPAPAGWKKKFTPKEGAIPGKNEIIFIAPDGEEIKSKTQLRGYLKSHPAGVTFKEFDWSTGNTPRRSSRLSGKTKASESPENEPPKKSQRKLSSKKVTKEKGDGSEDEATSEGGKETPGASNADPQDTVEHGDKDVVTEKDAGEDLVKGGDVGEPAAEEEKAAGEGQEAAPEEQKTDAMELEVAAEEHKSDVQEPESAVEQQKSDVVEKEAPAEEQRSDVVKEQEAAAAAAAAAAAEEEEEQKSDVKEGQEAAAAEEQKPDVKEKVGGADEEKEDVTEEAADMDVLLGTDDNEATDAVNEDVQLELGNKKEGDQVSDSSKQSNGGGEEKGVENTSLLPSQVSEEDKQAAEFWSAEDWSIQIPNVPGEEEEQGPSDFLDSLPDDFLDDALAAGPAELGDQPKHAASDPPKAEKTADPVPGESSSKDEAENQKSAGDEDAVMQEADIEEKKQEDP